MDDVLVVAKQAVKQTRNHYCQKQLNCIDTTQNVNYSSFFHLTIFINWK